MKNVLLVFGLLFSFPALAVTESPKPPPPKIILDPGHGGKDPGAISKTKIREKDIVLKISAKLAAILRKKGAEVSFTRQNDRFIELGKRNEIANRRQCDLFLSIHANASPRKDSEGIEIYYLNKATDSASRRIAARENAGAPKKEKDIEMILSDLIQTAATEESAELAKKVAGSIRHRMQKKYRVKEIGVKTALFYVLVGAKCPSLLIETGFITNPKEGRRLKQARYQMDLVRSIAEGISVYLSGLEQPANDL